MSSESIALFRKNASTDLRALAEHHIQHDLTPTDRETLKTAASKFSTHALLGSLAGVALGSYFAFRLRQNRLRMYTAFRAAEKPTHVRFASGREEAIPDVTPLMRPSVLGDVATFVFFGGAGTVLGGELGLVSGGWAARREVGRDEAAKGRLEGAFRAFRIDVLKKEIEALEKGGKDALEL